MRTSEQEVAAYTWLTVGRFADALNVSHEHIRALIREGSIENVMDVSRRGSKIPEYRIHPDELERFVKDAKERARLRNAA